MSDGILVCADFGSTFTKLAAISPGRTWCCSPAVSFEHREIATALLRNDLLSTPERLVDNLELTDRGDYAERAELQPGLTWTTDRPFPVTIDPAALR